MTPDAAGGAPTAALVARLDYPMYVVTASDGSSESGCLAGFVTQCSIDPVRFLVCISVVNHTARVAPQASVLGVHLLGSDQHEMAVLFGELSGDVTDKFAAVQWHRGASGAPVLDDCAAWFEGQVLGSYDLGDHSGYLVAPVAGGPGPHPGQLSYSAVRDVQPGHAARS